MKLFLHAVGHRTFNYQEVENFQNPESPLLVEAAAFSVKDGKLVSEHSWVIADALSLRRCKHYAGTVLPTDNQIESEGIRFDSFLSEFAEVVQQHDQIICWNYFPTILPIKASIFQVTGKKPNFARPTTHSVMKDVTKAVGLLNDSGKPKWPTLIEAYVYFFRKPYDVERTVYQDLETMTRIYHKHHHECDFSRNAV